MADSNSKGYRKLTRKPLQRPLDKEHSIEAYYIHKLYSTCLPFNSDIQRYSEQDVFKELVKLAINILDFDRFGILLLSEDRQTMIGTWGTDSNGEIVDETEFSSPIDANLEPIMSAVKDQGQIILWDEVDILDFDRQSKNGVNHIGMGWNAGYAFWVNNRIAGWVAADNLLNKQEFSAIHQQLFRMIGDFIGQFLTAKMQMKNIAALNESLINEKQRLEINVYERTKALEKANAELARIASEDALTGIYNRRFFMEALAKELSRSHRNNHNTSILMIDIDHFKKVNDTYGHAAGDTVIKNMALILKQALRDHDIAARIGGEEFAIILTDANLENAVHVAERIRINTEQAVIPHSTLQLKFTISIGVYQCNSEQLETPNGVLKMADIGLYEAKNSGRNRVCVATNSPPQPAT